MFVWLLFESVDQLQPLFRKNPFRDTLSFPPEDHPKTAPSRGGLTNTFDIINRVNFIPTVVIKSNVGFIENQSARLKHGHHKLAIFQLILSSFKLTLNEDCRQLYSGFGNLSDFYVNDKQFFGNEKCGFKAGYFIESGTSKEPISHFLSYSH